MTDCEREKEYHDDELEGIMSTDCEIEKNQPFTEDSLELELEEVDQDSLQQIEQNGNDEKGLVSDAEFDLPMSEIPKINDEFGKIDLDSDFINQQIDGIH